MFHISSCARALSDSSLYDSARDAFTLGEVEGAEVDINSWQITHLHVKLISEATEQFGFKKPIMGRHLVVLLPVSIIKAVGDVVSLDKSVEELESIVKPKKD